MKLRNDSKTIIFLYVLTCLFWISLVLMSTWGLVNEITLENLRRFTQVPLVVIPLVGAFLGFKNSDLWGGRKTVMGRSVLAISFGLLAWAGGMMIWNYYLFFTTTAVPYPSAADAIFILSWPLWTYGLVELSRAIGLQFALHKNKVGKFLLFGIPLVVIAISVYLLMYVARGGITYENPLKLFFDLFYPLGDVVILSVTAVVYALSKKYLGGTYKVPIMMLFVGFAMNYFSDFLFSYTTTKETYFNGHFVDFLFTTTMFVLCLGLSMLDSRSISAKE